MFFVYGFFDGQILSFSLPIKNQIKNTCGHCFQAYFEAYGQPKRGRGFLFAQPGPHVKKPLRPATLGWPLLLFRKICLEAVTMSEANNKTKHMRSAVKSY